MTLAEMDNDCLTIIRNLRKERQTQERRLHILGHEVVDALTSGRFYLAVVQTTIILGSETWVVTPIMSNTLGVSHHWVTRQITGQLP